jgi:hypothetical protein
MLRQLMIAATLVCGLFLTGCATVIKGTTQSLSVVATHNGAEVRGARCELSNSKGVWYVTTPGAAPIHRGYGELDVVCKLAGFPDGIAHARSSTTGSVYGNILLGGAIGATVDIANGAAYDYPSRISVAMGQEISLDKTAATGASAEATPSHPIDPNAPVPFLNAARQAKFKEFLTKPMPRAFAISTNGHYGNSWTDSKSSNRDRRDVALSNCKEVAGIDCQLYAVDDRLVYAGPPAQPVQAAAQAAEVAPAAPDTLTK